MNIVLGLVAFVLGIFGIISWWPDFGAVLRGLIPFLLLLGGLVAIGAGLSKEKLFGSDEEVEDAGQTDGDVDERVVAVVLVDAREEIVAERYSTAMAVNKRTRTTAVITAIITTKL